MKFHRLLALCAFAGLAALSLQAKPELNLYAWSEYVPQAVIDGFTRQTGIEVNYETYASNEELLSKLLAGGTAYDLIQPTDYMAEVMIREKMLAPLDYTKLTLLKNIDPEYLKLPHDPEQRYTVPWMVGTVGLVVNTENVKTPVQGYADLFKPEHAGRIVALNDNREMVTWALLTLGRDPNQVTPQAMEAVKPLLAKWIPLVKLFDSDSPKTALLNGDVDLGVVWSGEGALLWNENKKFTYVLPKEGAHRFVDVLAVPATAKNKEAAHAFIQYILRPEVSRLVSELFPYTNPNHEARKLLTPEQLANPASYPPTVPLTSFKDIGKAATLIDQVVTDLKNSQ